MNQDNPQTSSLRRERPGRILRWVALAVACAWLVHVTILCFLVGWSAFSLSSWAQPDFVFVSGVPGLALVPFFLVAFVHGRGRKYRHSALWMAWGVFLFGLLVAVPRGAPAVGWSVQPLIVLLVTCMFGVRPGLAQASLAVFALLGSVWLSVQGYLPGAVVPDDVWITAGVAGLVIVAMALCGALLHRALAVAISAEEEQVHQIDQAKRALRHRENLLRHALRIETVGEMSSMVVHQLRNQFQLMLGHTALGARRTEGFAAEQFQAIADSISKSNELLESLLGLARTQSGEVQAVDLQEACVHLAESYRRVLPACVELILEVPDQPVEVMLEAQGLEHAVLNLILNARQAMVGNGVICLRLLAEPERAIIEVEDTGSGISKADMEQIFRPFFTTKEKGKGTGLGLAAVERFVRSSNGEVAVRSEPGVGTTFSLVFPRLSSIGVQAS